MRTKAILTIIFLLVSTLSFSENNSVKIIGPLGLTRSFQNNINNPVRVVVKVRKNSKNLVLKNIRNGKQASSSFTEKKNNNVYTFSNVNSGVWSIMIKNVDDILSVNIK